MMDKIEPEKLAKTFKRKRTSTVSCACVPCRRKHVKCDGKNPCSRCVKKGEQCSFKVAQKRGPAAKPKKTDQVFTGAPNVSTTIRMEQNNHAIKPDIIQPTKIITENGLIDSQQNIRTPQISAINHNLGFHLPNVVSTYLQVHQIYVAPFQPISVPNVTYEEVRSNQVDTVKSSLLYAILANGASLMGNKAHVHELLNLARNCITSVYDVTCQSLASTYWLLSKIYSKLGDSQKMFHYLGIAQTMTRGLLFTSDMNTEVMCIYLSSLIGMADVESDRIEQCHMYEKVVRIADSSFGKYQEDPGAISICKVNGLIGKTMCEAFMSVFNPHWKRLSTGEEQLANLQEVETTIFGIDRIRGHPYCKEIAALIYSCRAAIHLFNGSNELASVNIDATFQATDEFYSPYGAGALTTLAIIQTYVHSNEGMEQIKQKMKLCFEGLPKAPQEIKKIDSLNLENFEKRLQSNLPLNSDPTYFMDNNKSEPGVFNFNDSNSSQNQNTPPMEVPPFNSILNSFSTDDSSNNINNNNNNNNLTDGLTNDINHLNSVLGFEQPKIPESISLSNSSNSITDNNNNSNDNIDGNFTLLDQFSNEDTIPAFSQITQTNFFIPDQNRQEQQNERIAQVFYPSQYNEINANTIAQFNFST